MADLLSYALTTVNDVKETLGIESGDSSKNNLIIRKVNQATEMIENYCNNRRFKETTYTQEEYDAPGTSQLILRNYPVTDTQSFSLQRRSTSTNEDSWDDIDSELYFVDKPSGVVDANFTLGGRWNSYRATYSAGFSTIPADISEACVTLAAYLVDNAQSGSGVAMKKEGQREIRYHKPEQSKSLFEDLGLDDILAPYVYPRLIDNV